MRLQRSRKGQIGEEDSGASSLLVAGVIAIVVLLVGILLYTKVFLSTGGEFDDGLCRTSINMHSKLLYASASEFATNIECKPRDIDVNTNNEDAFRDTAEAMRFCYDRWNPDDRLTNGDLELFSDNGVYCNPCAFLTFTGDKGLDGFDVYLSEAKVPGTDLTYTEYFTPGISEEALGNTPGNFATTTPSLAAYKDGTDASILFLYAKGESVHTIKDNFDENPNQNVKEIGSSAAIGAGAGAAVVAATFFVVGTGGLGLIAFGAAGFAVTAIGGTTGGLLEYFFGESERPEWVAMVVMRPNEDDSFTGLGCEYIEQQTAQLGPKDV